jgi:hypothetical protein
MVWRRNSRKMLTILVIDGDCRIRQALKDYYCRHIWPCNVHIYKQVKVFMASNILQAQKKIDEKISDLELIVFSQHFSEEEKDVLRVWLNCKSLSTSFLNLPIQNT